MLLISGLKEQNESVDPFKESIRKRTPWLLINLITAFMSAVVVLFQDTIEQVVVLAVAMPIITGMGGNSSFSNISTGNSRSRDWTINVEKDKSMY